MSLPPLAKSEDILALREIELSHKQRELDSEVSLFGLPFAHLLGVGIRSREQ